MKKIKLLCPAMVLTAGCITFLAGCGGTYTARPYEYTNPPPYTYTIPLDPEITLDGNLTEDIWTEKDDAHWMTVEHVGRGAKVRMTSWIGEEAVYFAFDVDDPMVYVNPAKESWNNSCMEVYLSDASPDALRSGMGHAFEVDYVADGKQTRLNKWHEVAGKMGWDGIFGCAVQYKGGPLNTVNCNGYTMEAYFPLSLLGLTEKPDEVRAYLAVNFSNSFDIVEREYWDPGRTGGGCVWSEPSTWYRWSEDGFLGK